MDWMSWKTWTVIGLIIVALFAIYAFAATQSARIDNPLVESRTVKNAPPRTMPAVAPGVGIIHTEWLETQSGSYRSERNLFAYREPPPPPIHIIQLPPTPEPEPDPVDTGPPPPPPPPQFPYKYIGTFGAPGNPIATFSGNGEILNVRVGETIDGKFILRGIGIESAEIAYVGFPPDQKTRIPLGQ